MFFRNIRHKLAQNNFFGNLYRLKYSSLALFYNINDLNIEYYNKIKDIGDQELEHQIGRLVNFKNILSEIDSKGLNGDIIEFGTWKGFSLLWIAYLSERLGMLQKKKIGFDCFSGLPNGEGVFKAGSFADTSRNECWDHIFRSKNLYDSTKKNIYIEKYFFNQKQEIAKRLEVIGANKFCFVHVDSDISSSAIDIFSLLNDFDLLNDTSYILFDDYGCVGSYGETVDNLMSKMANKWDVEVHSSTKLTKNYKLVRK